MEVRANPMPDGGIVTTFTDITPSVKAAEELERANESLERRVQERTEELTRLNTELGRAKGEAEQANISKTRFLAAASHDILQPLNAARLYVTSLVERQGGGNDAQLVGNIDASLDAVEEIFGALLDISRLDTGAMKPEIVSFRIDELLRQLEVEFAPLAQEKGLRAQLRALLAGGAIRPAPAAAAPAEPRLQRDQIHAARAACWSAAAATADGCASTSTIPGSASRASKKRAIFQEFHRLDQGAKVARGLGLGLSIVERIARVLDHKIAVTSARRPRLAASRSRCRSPPPFPRASTSATRARSTACSSPASPCCASTTSSPFSTAWKRCSAAGAAASSRRRTSTSAIAVIAEAKVSPDGLLVDYHLDEGNGIEAIAELRRRFGADLTAILITADRSPRVREEPARTASRCSTSRSSRRPCARCSTQWRVQRVAAAE